MAEKLNNPFVVYGYKGQSYFCDRENETEKIIQGLNNERNITLIAPRRIGKTGLIHHVFSRIKQEQPDICCIYIDILATKTLEQFVQLMARNVLGRLDTVTQNTLHKVQNFFSAFRPTMTFDATTGMPTFSLDIAKDKKNSHCSVFLNIWHNRANAVILPLTNSSKSRSILILTQKHFSVPLSNSFPMYISSLQEANSI